MYVNSAPTFPDVSKLEKSQDGLNYIYGGSIAINGILDNLRNLAGRGTPWKLLLVNGLTIANNVFDKDLSEKEMFDRYMVDCDMLGMYMEAYAASFRDKYKMKMVIYLPDYSAISPNRLRDNSKNNNGRVQLFYDKVRKSLTTDKLVYMDTEYGIRSFIPVGSSGNLPYKYLASIIKSNVLDRDHVALISHCALDLHVINRANNIHLLDRYTKNIIYQSEFGVKLDSEGRVPFGNVTHAIFGDKIHISPFVSGKKKTELLELASKQKWNYKSQQYILDTVVSHLKVKREDVLIRNL